ncbi:MAG: alpha/beta hydrolase fold domain-containing protein [Candidatus Hydrogenedens sp.]|nr:alpha/beta hydrolase fold domain-containing protein [Candidatus Hydrogenedens sp.]
MLFRRFSLLAAACCALGLSGCPMDRPAPGVVRLKDVTYAQAWQRVLLSERFRERPLKMDIVRPADAAESPAPAVVMVHGGGFTDGSRDDGNLVDLAARLAQAGYVCFLIDYRVAPKPPDAPEDLELPESLLALDLSDEELAYLLAAAHAAAVDTRAAIRHVRANAEGYGIDPKRIAVLGESAGAFAALAAGFTPPEDFAGDEGYPVNDANAPGVSVAVDSVVSLWGNGDHVLDDLMPDSPALLLVHGTADSEPGTPFEASERLYDAAAEAGVPATLVPVPGADHGAWDFEVDGKDLADWVIAFLGR